MRLFTRTRLPKWLIFTAILLNIAETTAGLIVPLFTKDLVDQLAHNKLQLSVILFLAGSFLVQTISGGFSYYLMSYIGEAVVSSVRRRLWNQVLELPVSYFDEQESGETMSRITQDTNTVKTLIVQHLVSFVTGIISIAGAVVILLFIDWKMTVIMLLAVPVSILIIMPLGRKMYRISKDTQTEMAGFSADLGRVLTDIRLVKAYSAEEAEGAKGFTRIQELFRYGLKEARIQAVISPFMTVVMMLVLVVLIGYGGVRVASGALTAGSLVAIIIYMFQIVIPFSQMASFFTAFQKAMGATDRIQSILTLEKESETAGLPVTQPAQNLSINNVSFGYDDNHAVLKEMNLQIPAGKTTAFVGPSGSGKTTLFALLERFYEPSSGKILLGKHPIDEFNLHSWRTSIGYVSQESPIMSGTIHDNICYGMEGDIKEEDIKKAAKLANAAEFIERFPDQYETAVGERGIKLSGGQRQRIAIARAFMRSPQILLLDEATSNLDSDSERLVQKALDQLMTGRTTLVIAHRLSTIVNADQIVVIEHGKITGIGTHETLSHTHALYQKLASQQFKT
ncbi:multidrug ABC transporter permease [Bacillus sp. FJAT-27231]|uniref:ABC transporter ATP-binding protein n=1 Tax=Bacillus sp. FJAT-27231 TaxID=1679168 RepID=UPI000670A1A2|nr:ABC transporter ATP-binding protein [Bacillus sp. FJAT-27231]KMY53695.1 multidrug ABC transporter permease [Bacillus sp. FJAT-27231]